MNSKISYRTSRLAAALAISLWVAAAASAGTLVTFQVDMSNAPFDPGSQTVGVHGSFNGNQYSAWVGIALTNDPPGSAVWRGATTVATNGIPMQYKYTIESSGTTTYETVFLGGSHNRLVMLPPTNGGSLVLTKAYFNDTPPAPIITPVTFQVDMAQQINNGVFNTNLATVNVRSIFNGWADDFPMTNDPTILTTNKNGLVSSNVYVYTYDITNSPGVTLDFKFHISTGDIWESPAANTGDPNDNNNRFFNLADSGTQKLPIVYFSDAPYVPLVTNDVMFQVDMTAEILNGNFTPGAGTVEVRGDFNGWGTPQILCTNDLAAVNTNLYSAVVHFMDGIGASHQYKFWSMIAPNGGWENGNNRVFNLENTNLQILPVVFFDNINPSSLLPADTVVTFSVNMTNAVGTDAHAFDPATDSVYVNGLPAGTFATWDTFLPQLTNNPVGSRIYTLDYPMLKGSPVRQTYKYSINGFDNEAAAGSNHVRYVRSTGTYAMPLDKFGNQLVEASFGDLKAAHGTPGHVLISWLGRPGVHLQSRTNLVSGSWVDHLETDGLSATNWPTGSGGLFFRLIGP